MYAAFWLRITTGNGGLGLVRVRVRVPPGTIFVILLICLRWQSSVDLTGLHRTIS